MERDDTVGLGMRKFDTGATRNVDEQRIDPEGFMSPLVVEAFCEYMNRNRVQADGSIRDSDNWQRGIPLPAYMKSLSRHHLELWHQHRYPVEATSEQLKDTLCAIIFNASGYLFEVLSAERGERAF